MHVNFFHKVFRGSLFKLCAAIMLGVCAVLLLAAFISDKPNDELFTKRVNLAIRSVGHQLLLQAGDSTTVVPPVVEKSKGVYVLQFQNELAFQPDTLVALVQRSLAKTGLSKYTVTVQECFKPGIIYGFEINPRNNSIKACNGRSQPKGCYTIEIAFADYPRPSVPYKPIGMMISSVSLLLALVLIGRSTWPKKLKIAANQDAANENESKGLPTIGKFVFDGTNQCLRISEEMIALTDKESKVLTVLNRNIGQLTLREELIQEVWTDEGVITGRSLDMFISKLRKKLSADPGLRITNVHGKGYKLEIVGNTDV
jgi:DNA-binding winged helix-turn-helix (wHTH) protein